MATSRPVYSTLNNLEKSSVVSDGFKYVTYKQEQELKALLQGATKDEGIIYTDIHNNRYTLYTMLLTIGYFAMAGESVMRSFYVSASLRNPNREVRSIYTKEIVDLIEATSKPMLLSPSGLIG